METPVDAKLLLTRKIIRAPTQHTHLLGRVCDVNLMGFPRCIGGDGYAQVVYIITRLNCGVLLVRCTLNCNVLPFFRCFTSLSLLVLKSRLKLPFITSAATNCKIPIVNIIFCAFRLLTLILNVKMVCLNEQVLFKMMFELNETCVYTKEIHKSVIFESGYHSESHLPLDIP